MYESVDEHNDAEASECAYEDESREDAAEEAEVQCAFSKVQIISPFLITSDGAIDEDFIAHNDKANNSSENTEEECDVKASRGTRAMIVLHDAVLCPHRPTDIDVWSQLINKTITAQAK